MHPLQPVDGDARQPLAAVPDVLATEVIPVRLQYPGAPLPRVFQIEDHAVDIGGYPPDRSHLATALLIELVRDHSSDWFLAPVPAPYADSAAPGTGVVIPLSGLKVRNTFDESDDLMLPPGETDPAAGPDEPIGPWHCSEREGSIAPASWYGQSATPSPGLYSTTSALGLTRTQI